MPLSGEEFAEYAREQIRTADALLARHRPASGIYCQCGRTLPCSQADAVRARKAHYLSRLGLAEPTVALPTVRAAPPAQHPPTGLRALLARLTSQDH